MFDFEKAIAAWIRSLETNSVFTKDDIRELERHIRDEVADLISEGADQESAYRTTLRKMGQYGDVESAYRDVFWGKTRRKRRFFEALSSRMYQWKLHSRLARRNLFRDKLSTGINIIGFAVAIGCCILVFQFLLVLSHLDTYHVDAERIFQIQQNLASRADGVTRMGPTPMPMGPLLP